MATRSFTLGLFAAASTALLATSAQAGDPLENLLIVDLSVVNQVTITATTGLSFGTATGGTTTGVYLQNFFNGGGVGGYGSTTGGSFASFLGTGTDTTPSLFRSTVAGGDPGLNIWSFETTATFTAGTQAFTGSGTWTVTAAQYADMLAGNTSGLVYFPADTFDDVTPNTALLGTYSVIPTPGAAAMLGLGGLVALRRRR